MPARHTYIHTYMDGHRLLREIDSGSLTVVASFVLTLLHMAGETAFVLARLAACGA